MLLIIAYLFNLDLLSCVRCHAQSDLYLHLWSPIETNMQIQLWFTLRTPLYVCVLVR